MDEWVTLMLTSALTLSKLYIVYSCVGGFLKLFDRTQEKSTTLKKHINAVV